MLTGYLSTVRHIKSCRFFSWNNISMCEPKPLSKGDECKTWLACCLLNSSGYLGIPWSLLRQPVLGLKHPCPHFLQAGLGLLPAFHSIPDTTSKNSRCFQGKLMQTQGGSTEAECWHKAALDPHIYSRQNSSICCTERLQKYGCSAIFKFLHKIFLYLYVPAEILWHRLIICESG